MSLLNQASPWSTESKKKAPAMLKSFEKLLPSPSETLEVSPSTEKPITSRTLVAPDEDGSQLSPFQVSPGTIPLKTVIDIPPQSTSKIEAFYAMNPALSPTSSYSKSYGPLPYYKGIGSNNEGNNSSQLMEKLNYMIHLLEEQQKEPTQNIAEEFALYGLLGVFIIYVVDSFTKVGKYTR